VDPIPDPLLLRKADSAGDRTRTSGSVGRNSDHLTTEAVINVNEQNIHTISNTVADAERRSRLRIIP
jgi:hypothetical protein